MSNKVYDIKESNLEDWISKLRDMGWTVVKGRPIDGKIGRIAITAIPRFDVLNTERRK